MRGGPAAVLGSADQAWILISPSLSHQHLVLVASTYQPTDQPKTFPTLPISMPNLLNPPPTQLNPPLLCNYFSTRTNRPTNLEVNLPMPSPPLWPHQPHHWNLINTPCISRNHRREVCHERWLTALQFVSNLKRKQLFRDRTGICPVLFWINGSSERGLVDGFYPLGMHLSTTTTNTNLGVTPGVRCVHHSATLWSTLSATKCKPKSRTRLCTSSVEGWGVETTKLCIRVGC